MLQVFLGFAWGWKGDVALERWGADCLVRWLAAWKREGVEGVVRDMAIDIREDMQV